jgi:xanthine dehydrogenase accessory factor
MKELRSILARLRAPGAAPAALATLCRVRGSSYRRPGARLLLTADGGRTGSISGGCLEDDVILRAQEAARTGAAQAVTYDTTAENDLVWGVGLGCHGVADVVVEKISGGDSGWADVVHEAWASPRDAAVAVAFQGGAAALGTRAALSVSTAGEQFLGDEKLRGGLREALARRSSHWAETDGVLVFYEYLPLPTPLLIFGAGDDAQPLCQMAAALGFAVKVVDPRPAYATKERFPAAETVFVAKTEELARHMAVPTRTAAVVMTHHYLHDVPYLRWLLPQPLAYLGLLGPRQRAEKIFADLAAEGLAVTEEMRARLRAPVGLDLGAETPEAVALAVLAEVQATLAGRDGRPLRERRGAIHE